MTEQSGKFIALSEKEAIFPLLVESLNALWASITALTAQYNIVVTMLLATGRDDTAQILSMRKSLTELWASFQPMLQVLMSLQNLDTSDEVPSGNGSHSLSPTEPLEPKSKH